MWGKIILALLIIVIVLIVFWINPWGWFDYPKRYLIAWQPTIMEFLDKIPFIGNQHHIILQSGSWASDDTTEVVGPVIVRIDDMDYSHMVGRGINVIYTDKLGKLLEYGTFDTFADGNVAARNVLNFLQKWPAGAVYQLTYVFDEGHGGISQNKEIYDLVSKYLPDFNKGTHRTSYVSVAKYGKTIKSIVDESIATIDITV